MDEDPGRSHLTSAEHNAHRRYRYSLLHDLLATARALWDAHIWPSRAWKRIKRSRPN